MTEKAQKKEHKEHKEGKGPGAHAPRDPRAEKQKKGKPAEAAKPSEAAPKAERPSASAPTPPRLLVRYKTEVVPRLMKELNETNALAVPRLTKIVVNMGVGKATENEKRLTEAVETLAMIAGQKPLVTRAKVSVASFRLREGLPIGCKVTLRKQRMYEFLDRLISLALPRVRDFRGLPLTSFDRFGNYTFGVSEQLIFPEVKADKLEFEQGMDITLCTSARTPERAKALLTALGIPFRKPGTAREDRLEASTKAQAKSAAGTKDKDAKKAAKPAAGHQR